MVYQPDNAIVASLEERMREAAALLLAHAEGLTPQERQLLHDIRRRDGRSRFRGLAAILAVSARCADPSVRLLVPEVCRGTIVAATPSRPGAEPCVVESFRLETAAQGAADVAQLEHVAQRQPHTADAALRSLLGHREAIGLTLDALHAERARLAANLRDRTPAFFLKRAAAGAGRA